MFSNFDKSDVEQLRYRTHLSRLATSVEGEVYIFIRKRLEYLENEFSNLLRN